MRVNVLDENGMLTWKLTAYQAQQLLKALMVAEVTGWEHAEVEYLKANLLVMVARAEVASKEVHDEQEPPSSGKEDVMDTESARGRLNGAADAALMDGSVRERVASLRREVEGLGKVSTALFGALSPVTRPLPPQVEQVRGLGVSAPVPERRSPQCTVAGEIDEIERIVRNVVNGINQIIGALEV